MTKWIYLAGAINGCTDDQAKTWRERVKEQFEGRATFLDPMDRDYRGCEDENVESIVVGDKQDISACDAIVANCPSPSWGTGMEIVYASLWCKPIHVVVAPGARVSPWLRYHATAVHTDLDEAVRAALA